MQKIFDFGKIDYYEKGAKINSVEVVLDFTENGDKSLLSICGRIWNSKHTDTICAGQCLDEIAKHVNTPLFKEVFRIWNLYHLNDMRPECEHQRALNWSEKATEKVTLYTFGITSTAFSDKQKLEKAIINAAKTGENPYITTPAERVLLNLNYLKTTHEAELPAELAPFYTLKKTEQKALGWLREDEHPDGILAKPCPVCRYKYGTEWKYLPIPDYDKKIILGLFKAPVREEANYENR